MQYLLSALILAPLVGAAFIFFCVQDKEEGCAHRARDAALWTTIFTFLASLVLWYNFNPDTADFQFVERYAWFKEKCQVSTAAEITPALQEICTQGITVSKGIAYHVGIDGISLFMILLTTFLMPLCILSAWKAIEKRVREFMICFLLMESFMIGVFAALDLVLFYVFFEGILIPMFLIIGIWGGDRRVYAAYKFFLYTLAGSVLFLLALLYFYLSFHTTDIPTLMQQAPTLGLDIQKWLWLAMLASFAVKVPMWPVHTWLPDAHVQAPTAGSVILAGVLLKIGGYGFLRFSLPMLPDASHYFAPLIFGLSITAVIYTSLVALVQEDMKKLIAYSSVAHMGFVTVGLFTFNQQGIEGALVQMISHGLVSGALFLCVGVVYDRVHTREIARYGGLVHVMPYYAFAFMFFTMASVGLPGTSGFVGEFLILVGAYQASSWVAFLIATGLVLGAAYMLWLYRRVIFGELTKGELKKLFDLDRREVCTFVPLMLVVLWLGIYPEPFLNAMHASVQNLLSQMTPPATPLIAPQGVLP